LLTHRATWAKTQSKILEKKEEEFLMSKRSILLVLCLALPTIAWCQGGEAQVNSYQAYSSGGASTDCTYQFSSGSGHTLTQYCLTENGNIVQFSNPGNIQFFNKNTVSSPVSEGYGLCDFQAPDPYYDYASDSRGWGPTVISRQSAKTMQFVRKTEDGLWELTQSLTQVDASPTSPGSVRVVMTLRNLSGDERTVVLVRHANVNVNRISTDDRFYATRNFAYGAEPGLSFGLGLTTNTFDFNAGGLTQSVPQGPNPCAVTENANFDQFAGDGSIGMVYSMTIPAGTSQTVQMTYKPL
jgi:hypothetical protein